MSKYSKYSPLDRLRLKVAIQSLYLHHFGLPLLSQVLFTHKHTPALQGFWVFLYVFCLLFISCVYYPSEVEV